jgi:membrane glycosyltransferase
LTKLGVGKPEVRELAEKLLAQGPEALTTAEKMLILSDAEVVPWLHRQAWIRPAKALAGWWQAAIRKYAR